MFLGILTKKRKPLCRYPGGLNCITLPEEGQVYIIGLMEFQFKKPVGLFLAGGGALGSWQAGCLERLVNSYGFKFDIVAGFSAGALNGAAYCLGRLHELKRMWQGLRPSSFLKISPRLIPPTLFSNKPLRRLLEGWMGPGPREFPSGAPLHVITLCLETGLHRFSEFKNGWKNEHMGFVDALLGSCAIPAIFPPARVISDGRRATLVDGGVVRNSHMSLEVFGGCRTVIAISNSRPEDVRLPVRGIHSYFESKARRILFEHVRKALESLERLPSPPQILHFRPEREVGLTILEFDGKKCAGAYEAGSEAADSFAQSGTL